MRKPNKLHIAKNAKNDEWYTQYKDIAAECRHHIDQFRGKSIYLPCDDESSQFWIYFKEHFNEFGLKHLTATHINHTGSSYRLDFDGKEVSRIELQGNGDFASEECSSIKDKCDIVCTNPPFSLFRQFFTWLYGKKFLVMGNLNAVCYMVVFPFLKSGEVWLGDGKNLDFILPDGSLKGTTSRWFTNLAKYTESPSSYPDTTALRIIQS